MTEVLSNGFYIKNCSLAAIATGERASSLVELRDKLAQIDESSVYYHFWGGRMFPQYVNSTHHNDFASWVHHRLHDPVLAERLNIIDPTEFRSLEDLRQEVLETIDRALDNYEISFWSKKQDRFYFISSKTIIFESSLVIEKPELLPKIIPILSPNSLFYHFIDARSRTNKSVDDFSVWLKMFGNTYDALIEEIQMIDPYFVSLTELRDELTTVVSKYFVPK